MSGVSHTSLFNIRRTDDGFSLTYLLQFESKKTAEIAFRATPIPYLEAPSDFRDYAQQVEERFSSVCCDVQPINGNQNKHFLKSLIRPSIVTELQNQIAYSQSRLTASRVQLFVLDIKDSQGCYTNAEEIINAEDEVAAFLQGPEPRRSSARKTFHQIVRNQQISFFLREGKLKHDIVTRQSAESAGFLQTSARGRHELCQLCEIVMNFFKMGFLVEGLHPQDYFVSTAPIKEPLSDRLALKRLHTLSLTTLYPSYYREMYSEQGEYYLAVTQIFISKHDYDESTQTSAITLIR